MSAFLQCTVPSMLPSGPIKSFAVVSISPVMLPSIHTSPLVLMFQVVWVPVPIMLVDEMALSALSFFALRENMS